MLHSAVDSAEIERVVKAAEALGDYPRAVTMMAGARRYPFCPRMLMPILPVLRRSERSATVCAGFTGIG